MAEKLPEIESELNSLPPTHEEYRPTKPRVIAPIDSRSRQEIEPLFDALGEYFNRTYRHVPGFQAATLCKSQMLYPYTPDAQTRVKMTKSRFWAINAAAEDQLHFVEVETSGLIINSHEGVPVISLALDEEDAETIIDKTKQSMTRAFSQLAEGGTVVGDYEWLDRVHLSLGYLPLARLPKGKLAMGEYCIERVKNLVPKSLRVNPVPKIYADFEVATNTVKGSNIENTSFAFSEIDIVKRAIDAAREYPKAEIILAVSPDFLLGKAALPDNVVSRFINSDAAYMKIRY